MSGFANSAWLNDKGEEIVLITAIDPGASQLKQFERDCYDSGLVAGIKSEQARIIKLLEQTQSPSHLWGGIGWSIALIKGEN